MHFIAICLIAIFWMFPAHSSDSEFEEDFSRVEDFFNICCEGNLFTLYCNLINANTGKLCHESFHTYKALKTHQTQAIHAGKMYCMLDGFENRRLCTGSCMHPKKQKRQ